MHVTAPCPANWNASHIPFSKKGQCITRKSIKTMIDGNNFEAEVWGLFACDRLQYGPPPSDRSKMFLVRLKKTAAGHVAQHRYMLSIT